LHWRHGECSVLSSDVAKITLVLPNDNTGLNYLVDNAELVRLRSDANWLSDANTRINWFRKGQIKIKYRAPSHFGKRFFTISIPFPTTLLLTATTLLLTKTRAKCKFSSDKFATILASVSVSQPHACTQPTPPTKTTKILFTLWRTLRPSPTRPNGDSWSPQRYNYTGI
jgi:hypothetical protein